MALSLHVVLQFVHHFCVNTAACNQGNKTQADADGTADDTGSGHAALEALGLGNSTENNTQSTCNQADSEVAIEYDGKDTHNHTGDSQTLTGLSGSDRRCAVGVSILRLVGIVLVGVCILVGVSVLIGVALVRIALVGVGLSGSNGSLRLQVSTAGGAESSFIVVESTALFTDHGRTPSF